MRRRYSGDAGGGNGVVNCSLLAPKRFFSPFAFSRVPCAGVYMIAVLPPMILGRAKRGTLACESVRGAFRARASCTVFLALLHSAPRHRGSARPSVPVLTACRTEMYTCTDRCMASSAGGRRTHRSLASVVACATLAMFSFCSGLQAAAPGAQRRAWWTVCFLSDLAGTVFSST